jgi:hypothetical protein
MRRSVTIETVFISPPQTQGQGINLEDFPPN